MGSLFDERPRSGWALLAFGGVVVVVAVVITLIVLRHDDLPFPGPEQVEPRSYADGWDEVAHSPLSARAGSRIVWTGDEVLVLGGETDGGCYDCDLTDGPSDSAAYDPVTDEWRRIADLPRPLLHYATAFAVAGGDVFARSVHARRGTLMRYDVGRDEWRTVIHTDIADLSLVGTDDRLLTVRRCTCPAHPPTERYLDLASGRWTELPADPFPSSWAPATIVVGDDVYRFARGLGAGGEGGGVAVLRAGADRWAVFDSDRHRTIHDEAQVVGDLIVDAEQPFAIDTPDTYPPETTAFDTRTGEWVDLPELTEPMESGQTASDGDHLWFGDVVLDGSTRTWSDGAYLPETATGAASVWIGDRWFAVGGETPAGLTQRAFTWMPPG